MKTIFDDATRDELIQRINSLDEHKKAQWGKMTQEEIGIFGYKHADHHLRQFNC
jgi:hypothetical protein